MSADNWAVCPKCQKTRLAAREAKAAQVAEQYGKIPVDRRLALKAAAEEYSNEEPDYSLREDYGLGVTTDGEFYVRYTGSCRDCNFEHRYEFTQQLPL